MNIYWKDGKEIKANGLKDERSFSDMAWNDPSVIFYINSSHAVI